MFPNPQDALPLPPRPDLEQYRKLAKELVRACAAPDARAAIGAWVDRWTDSLAHVLGQSSAKARPHWDRMATAIEDFAVQKLTAGERQGALADAQFVIARSHGFDSWPKLVAHVEALERDTIAAAFEAAADAIVAGDEGELERLLAAHPELALARSTREHAATLLHYVSANGVENWRQKTPANIVALARVLMDAGAEVDAEANVYGGGATTLGLVATSAHPRGARVQLPLLELLLDRGARMEHPSLAGNDHGIVLACLGNGCPEAAGYMAERGARLDLATAAGLGRMDVLRALIAKRREPGPDVTPERLGVALRYACGYGRTEAALLLLESGADPASHGGDGQTALHWAVIGGHLDTVRALLPHAPLEARNSYGGTVFGQALWSAAHGGDPDEYVAILEALVAAGAKPPERHPPVNAKVDAFLARHGSIADPARHWFGEQPRKRRDSP